MKHTPQRPFVPTGAPNAKPAPAGGGAFKIVPPFVHGEKSVRSAPTPRQPVEAAPVSPPSRSGPPPLPLVYVPPADTPPRAQQAAAESLAPIQQYMHSEPPIHAEPPGIDEYAYELPPVEHFVDSTTEEASATFHATGAMATPPGAQSDDVDTSEWSEADWQQFDWRAAAALGEASDPAANDAWSETDWDKAPPSGRDVRESAAKAIADALDGIARRIREGDLSLPSPGSGSNPSDIAATLAALLGKKR